MEGTADVRKILEEIEVVGVDVQNDADARIKREETVRVFAGLSHEIFGLSHADVAADAVVDAADRDGRIKTGFHQDFRDKAGRRGLAVRSGDCGREVVVAADLSQELCPGEHRNAELTRGDIFRIVGMDRRRKNCRVNILCDIFFFLTVINFYSETFQPFCHRGRLPVGAGNRKALGMQNFCKAAHRDAADAAEIDVC